jgi:hypothetical protein
MNLIPSSLLPSLPLSLKQAINSNRMALYLTTKIDFPYLLHISPGRNFLINKIGNLHARVARSQIQIIHRLKFSDISGIQPYQKA